MLAVGISHELRGCRLAFPLHIDSSAFRRRRRLSAYPTIAERLLLYLRSTALPSSC